MPACASTSTRATSRRCRFWTRRATRSAPSEAVKDLVDWKTFSPRLGVNVKLRESGTVMRASYGRYYQGSTTNLFSALSPAQAVTRRFGWNPATQAYDILQQITDPRGTYVVDPDLQAPYTDQYTIGVDHELMPSLAIGASYIHKRADDFVGRVDVGSTFEPEARTDPQTGAPLTVYRRTSPAIGSPRAADQSRAPTRAPTARRIGGSATTRSC